MRYIIVPLFMQKPIRRNINVPVTFNGRHLWIIGKRFVGLVKDPVNEMQAICVNLIIGKFSVWINGLKLVSEIVANMVFELLPKNARRGWIAMEKNDRKE